MTTAEFISVLADKGYDSYQQFYCRDFDFIDRMEAGLLRIENLNPNHKKECSFSISGYPVWNGEDQPCVSSYMSCVYRESSFYINRLELTYKNGKATDEIQVLNKPVASEIPKREALLRKLAGSVHPKSSKRKGIKR